MCCELDHSAGPGQASCAVLRQESCIASHYLYEEDAVVRCGCVPELVHTFYDGVERCVIADCGVCPVKIVVNGARQADYREVVFSSDEFAEELDGMDDTQCADAAREYCSRQLERIKELYSECVSVYENGREVSKN